MNNPKSVSRNPAGWLRKAIEQDFAASSDSILDVEAQSKVEKALKFSEEIVAQKLRAVEEEQGEADPISELWRETLQDLSLALAPGIFNAHLAGSRLTTSNGGLVITVSKRLSREWVDKKLRPIIEKKLARHVEEGVNVDFEVAVLPHVEELC